MASELEHGDRNEAMITKEDSDQSSSDDFYWNYKNCEFLLDGLFSVTANFEKYGDGKGCYIINKILLPIFYGLNHSNYSNSIHRFITRVL